MTTLNLSMINIRINKETAIASHQTYINKQPDFQRDYDAWDDKLKTRFVETMLIGRAINPIWTILNPDENSEEILDGMHRITTACNFLNNVFKLNDKYITCEEYKKYNKKTFSELTPDDQAKIRNYNFTFNNLDSSYRTDINKRRDMYEILNRSSKTLNEYEFNKVLYNPFYDIISEYKDRYNNFFKNKSDKRGGIETEMISCIVLSSTLPKSWTSINTLIDNYLKKEIGETEEKVNNFLENNTQELKNKLELISKIINRLNSENIFNEDKRIFNKLFIPYKFIICRLYFKLKNISVFNRHVKDILYDFKSQILDLDVDIQSVLECKSRNAMFQKKLVNLIDDIIDKHYDKKDEKNNRLFNKKTIIKKCDEQDWKCNICKCDLLNIPYEGDHIIPWSNGGKTEYSNLQVLCKYCHNKKV
tara:strand:- start:2535 stop:3791 length:1257 start_codon:yes stop_codon:yes gene_type:complete